jgi:hypothetical protein
LPDPTLRRASLQLAAGGGQVHHAPLPRLSALARDGDGDREDGDSTGTDADPDLERAGARGLHVTFAVHWASRSAAATAAAAASSSSSSAAAGVKRKVAAVAKTRVPLSSSSSSSSSSSTAAAASDTPLAGVIYHLQPDADEPPAATMPTTAAVCLWCRQQCLRPHSLLRPSPKAALAPAAAAAAGGASSSAGSVGAVRAFADLQPRAREAAAALLRHLRLR